MIATRAREIVAAPISSAEVAAVVRAAAAAMSAVVADHIERGPGARASARRIGASAREWATRLIETAQGRGQNDAAEALEIDGRCLLVAVAALADALADPDRTPVDGPTLSPEDYHAALQTHARALRDLAARANGLP